METGEIHHRGKESDAAVLQDIYIHRKDDENDMIRMGKEQSLRRNFKVLSITSFSFVTMMGWVFVPLNAPSIIAVAGTGGAIVMYIANFFAYLSIVLSLAEMSSIAPTAGGQYHWVSEFAPPSQQKFLSYLSGWLSSLSWLVGVASGMFLIGNLIPALIALTHTSYQPQAWQGYLFTVGIVTILLLVNTYLAKYFPAAESFILAFTIASFVAIIAVLLAMSPTLLSASEVFQTFSSDTNSTTILEILASQSLVFFWLLGSDSTAHMAEETQHANIVIPRAMIGSYITMGIVNFATLIVVCYVFIDPTAAFDTETGYPFLQVYITATGSIGGAIAITCVQIVLIVLSGANFMASTSRQVFAFARDDGLPFSRFVSRVSRRMLSPVNSLLVVAIFAILISLIGLGSTVAFNAIVSLQVMAIASTYEVSMLCIIWRRIYGKPLPRAAWSLGRYGLFMNICGAIYGLYLLVYAAMTGVYPVTPDNLNWAPVMFGGILVLAMVHYFVWARRIYEGPVVYVKAG